MGLFSKNQDPHALDAYCPHTEAANISVFLSLADPSPQRRRPSADTVSIASRDRLHVRPRRRPTMSDDGDGVGGSGGVSSSASSARSAWSAASSRTSLSTMSDGNGAEYGGGYDSGYCGDFEQQQQQQYAPPPAPFSSYPTTSPQTPTAAATMAPPQRLMRSQTAPLGRSTLQRTRTDTGTLPTKPAPTYGAWRGAQRPQPPPNNRTQAQAQTPSKPVGGAWRRPPPPLPLPGRGAVGPGPRVGGLQRSMTAQNGRGRAGGPVVEAGWI